MRGVLGLGLRLRELAGFWSTKGWLDHRVYSPSLSREKIVSKRVNFCVRYFDISVPLVIN